MNATSARVKAERCFALARSTTFPAERDTAVARGIAIAEGADLDLDLFDIPGRAKTLVPDPPPSRFADDLFTKGKAPPFYSSAEYDDVMRRFREHMAAGMRETAREQARARGEFHGGGFAGSARTATEAMERMAEALRQQQRATERATAERNRQEREQWAAMGDKVANGLWAHGWRAYRDEDGEDGRRRWHLTNPQGSTFENVDDQRLVAIGQQHGAMPDGYHWRPAPDRCPGCGTTILFGDSCVDCDRSNRAYAGGDL